MEDKEIELIIEDVIRLFFIPHFEALGMNATGNWKEQVEARGNSIWGQPYSEQLVEGTPSGTIVSIPKLIEWAMAKFGYDFEEAKRVAFAVRNKIYAEGTDYWPEGTDLLEFLESPQVRDYMISRIAPILIERQRQSMIEEINLAFRR